MKCVTHSLHLMESFHCLFLVGILVNLHFSRGKGDHNYDKGTATSIVTCKQCSLCKQELMLGTYAALTGTGKVDF